MVKILKAYKIEIKPTEEQKIKIHKTIGTCKFIYNLYLSEVQKQYDLDKSFITGFTFSKWLNNEFVPDNPSYSWIKEVSSKAVKQSIMNGETAYKKFFKKESKFPRFKKKNDRIGIYLPKNSKTDFTLERHRIKVPTLGFIRLKEFGYIPLKSVIKSGTITKIADRYFISVLVEENPKQSKFKKQSEQVGIDLGLKDFAIISNGEIFKNINKSNKVKRKEKKLKREQRALCRKLEVNKKNKKNGGENCLTKNLNKNILKVQKQHYKLSNIRREYVRFVVNSLVQNNPKFISIEDLNVKGMMKNRHLSKSISKQNFYYFREYLTYKCKKHNIELRVIDRWYPSSKLCNCCGQKKKDLKLSDRTFKCECGNVIDRDLQASMNTRDCEIYKIA